MRKYLIALIVAAVLSPSEFLLFEVENLRELIGRREGFMKRSMKNPE